MSFSWHICCKTWFNFDTYIIWALRYSGIWRRVTGWWKTFPDTVVVPKGRTSIIQWRGAICQKNRQFNCIAANAQHSHVHNLSSHGTTISVGFWYRNVLFHFITALKLPPLLPHSSRLRLLYVSFAAHENLSVRGARMISKLNKRQHDFKLINCNSFCMQISRPKQYPVVARSD